MSEKKFKILSIDGGGIRGVFPAMFLSELEANLQSSGKSNWQIYQNFDLICGTSTGGIIALALALGIPAKEIHELYLNHAKDIFGKKKSILKQIFYSSYDRGSLEKLIRERFKNPDNESDYRLKDCLTNVCIPIYDLVEGKPVVCKNDYHERFTRDYHIPAYKVALATSAAPTFFDPYSTHYTDLNGIDKSFSNKVDGGVFANNPTLLGITEAQEAFYKDLSDLKVLSIGTGHQGFSDAAKRKKWGISYWLNAKRKRIIDLFMQGQSQLSENIIRLMQRGIDKERSDNPTFLYDRITTHLDETLNVELDDTNHDTLKRLSERASHQYHENASRIIEQYID